MSGATFSETELIAVENFELFKKIKVLNTWLSQRLLIEHITEIQVDNG